MGASVVDEVSETIAVGAEALFAMRRQDGVFDFGAKDWTSTLATVGAITALHFADPARSAGLVEAGARWLCRTQYDDGGWSTIPGVAPEAGPTAVATAALHVLAPRAAEKTVRAGLAWLDAFGGIDAIDHRDMAAACRQFFVLAGWLDPATLPRIPGELALFPPLFRVLTDFRAPIVGAAALAQARQRRQGPVCRLVNAMARPAILSVLRQIYEHEGRTGEFSQDPWACGLICRALVRAGAAPDLVASSVEWLRSQANPDGSWNMIPLDLTWSSYAASGLIEAGYAGDGRLEPVKAMFHARQQHRPFTAFGCQPGFWSWSGARGWPVSLESAEVVSALARMPGGQDDDDVRSGVRWLSSQQDSRGSWSLCVRNTRVDNCGPCPHITTQAVNALLDSGVSTEDRRVSKAIRWLLTTQRGDGSFDSLWYRTFTAGTSVVLETLVRTGLAAHPVAVRARDWLMRAQLPDGSWSTGDSTAPGTVEETGWAVRALLAAGLGSDDPRIRRGVAWLLDARQPTGHWPAAAISDFVRNASRYPNGGLTDGLALRALARFRAAAQRRAVS